MYTNNYYKIGVEKVRQPQVNLEGPLEDASEMSLKGFHQVKSMFQAMKMGKGAERDVGWPKGDCSRLL